MSPGLSNLPAGDCDRYRGQSQSPRSPAPVCSRQNCQLHGRCLCRLQLLEQKPTAPALPHRPLVSPCGSGGWKSQSWFPGRAGFLLGRCCILASPLLSRALPWGGAAAASVSSFCPPHLPSSPSVQPHERGGLRPMPLGGRNSVCSRQAQQCSQRGWEAGAGRLERKEPEGRGRDGCPAVRDCM